MKKKENKSIAILLLVVMVALILVAGTYAKYTSSASGSDIATVAKWSFKVNDTEIAVTGSAPKVTFNLFDTINDTDGQPETDVAAGLIAPGTQGAFDLKLKNDAQVTAQYAIDYTVTKSDSTLPILFSVDGGTTWTSDLADVVASDATKLAIGSAEKTITVQWKWLYETQAENGSVTAGDTVDTALGVAGQTTAPTIEVTAAVTATQVD